MCRWLCLFRQRSLRVALFSLLVALTTIGALPLASAQTVVPLPVKLGPLDAEPSVNAHRIFEFADAPANDDVVAINLYHPFPALTIDPLHTLELVTVPVVKSKVTYPLSPPADLLCKH